MASFKKTTDGYAVLQDCATRPPGPICTTVRLELTSAAIMEAKNKSHQKRGPYLKLDDRMRANIHVCIYRLVVQLQHLMPREIKKSRTLHSLLPWGDCESRNAGTRNAMWNGSMKVKFSVTRSTTIYKIGSEKLKLALVCVRELQKLAIVAMKSLSI